MPKAQENKLNPLNNPNQPSKLDSKLSKKRERKEYFIQRYQAKKQEYHEWYLKRKEQAKQQEKEQLNKYYGAEAIRVMMNHKEYTELNSEKRKRWLDFIWTFKDLEKTGINNVVEIMRLREVADILISDYWDTAKQETKKGKSWNSLSEEQKERLISYWGQEKVRKDSQLDQALKKQVEQGKSFEKEIKKLVDISTFHEERGKIKCPCWHCEEIKQLKAKEKAELEKLIKEEEEKQERVECSNCGRKVKELDEENDICRRCMKDYE